MTNRGIAAKYLALSWPGRRLLTRAWLMGAVCVAGLRVARYERVRRVLKGMGRPSSLGMDEIAWVVNAAVSRVPGAKCLERAMVGEALLRAAGHPAEVCFGVSMEGGFGAHAWVEIGGRPVIGGEADREYERLGNGGKAT